MLKDVVGNVGDAGTVSEVEGLLLLLEVFWSVRDCLKRSKREFAKKKINQTKNLSKINVTFFLFCINMKNKDRLRVNLRVR